MRSPTTSPDPTPAFDARGTGSSVRVDSQPQLSMEPLLSARELAAILAVNLNYVYELAADGRLPSYKIGGNRRFRASEVEGWLRTCREPNRLRHLAASRRQP